MPRDLCRGLAPLDHFFQSRIRYKRGRPGPVGFFLDLIVIIASENVPLAVALLYRQPARLVPEKNVASFLQLSGILPVFPVSGIEDDQFPPVRERGRGRAARPPVLVRLR